MALNGHTQKKTEWNSALLLLCPKLSHTNTLKPMEDCRIQIPERAKHNVTQVAPLLKNMCLACASKRHIHCRQEGFLGLSRMFFLSQLCISWNHMPKLGFRAWTPKKTDQNEIQQHLKEFRGSSEETLTQESLT